MAAPEAAADSAVAAARAALLARAHAAADSAGLDSLAAHVYVEIVRESFTHTLDDELNAREIAQELRVPDDAVARALFAMRARGLGDLSVLAAGDPLTAAEAMDAPWVRALSASDRCVLRHALAARVFDLEAAQRACRVPRDGAARVRLARVLLAERAIVAERGRTVLARGALSAWERELYARAHRARDTRVFTAATIARRARTARGVAERLVRTCEALGLVRAGGGGGYVWVEE